MDYNSQQEHVLNHWNVVLKTKSHQVFCIFCNVLQ
jgi:hypothetical protein